MNYWWVNQNQTYRHEVAGGYLWSPKTSAGGRQNRFYESMTETKPGDIVFSFYDTYIKAIGVVSGSYESAPKPTEFGSAGGNWSNEGWFVPVTFAELKNQIRPKDHMDLLAPELPTKYSPLQPNGNGNQGVYLAPVPPGLAAVLKSLIGTEFDTVIGSLSVIEGSGVDEEQKRILDDQTISTTERQQLVKSRVGQGLYRSRVELIEQCCRLTGVTDRRFLRASHIKPWAKSTNREKLDGYNGLLLSPHVDHLFDRGFLTFDDRGGPLFSGFMPAELAGSWGLLSARNTTPLHEQQAAYMAYHRDYVFKGDRNRG
jgi:putative restriction endonuclease